MCVLFLDYQGFLIERKSFFIKELAILDFRKSEPEHYLFKPPEDISTLPHSYQKQADWVTKHCHGISWCAGGVAYEEIPNILTKLSEIDCCVYVKGLEKKRLISKLLPKNVVVNIEDELDCTSPMKKFAEYFEPELCDYHRQHCYRCNFTHFRCAVQNVQTLKKLYDEYRANRVLSFEDTEIEEVSCSCFC